MGLFLRVALGVAMASLACMGCNAGNAGNAGGGPTQNSSGASTSVGAGADPASPNGSGSQNPGAGSSPAGAATGGPCGYGQMGRMLHIADNIDLCVPPAVCTSENCPPPSGTCVAGACVYKGAYQGLKSLPQAWATYYCQLSSGGCNGVTQSEPPLTTATKVSTLLGLPLCEGMTGADQCVGIAASSAMVVGNSQAAVDPSTKTPVKSWGLGLSEASGLCYRLVGPGGSVVVALTDRCGGYCSCHGSGFQECGPCVSAPDMAPNCPCVGAAPPAWNQCCGQGCGAAVVPACDWCASNNHPHFDLDAGAYNVLCGAQAGRGSCQIDQVMPIACTLNTAWPPP